MFFLYKICSEFEPAWSTDPVSGQASLGSEGNHWEQKASEDVTERGGHDPATAVSRT